MGRAAGQAGTMLSRHHQWRPTKAHALCTGAWRGERSARTCVPCRHAEAHTRCPSAPCQAAAHPGRRCPSLGRPKQDGLWRGLEAPRGRGQSGEKDRDHDPTGCNGAATIPRTASPRPKYPRVASHNALPRRAVVSQRDPRRAFWHRGKAGVVDRRRISAVVSTRQLWERTISCGSPRKGASRRACAKGLREEQARCEARYRAERAVTSGAFDSCCDAIGLESDAGARGSSDQCVALGKTCRPAGGKAATLYGRGTGSRD